MKARYLLLLLAALLLIGTTQAAWLTGWDYRQELHINGSESGDLTDYQVMLQVYNTTDASTGNKIYLGTLAADDNYFSDLRITTSDGTTLCSIWNETQRADGWDIWVNVPSIPTTGVDVYVYYGGTATPVWDGKTTFPLLFDHFDGASLNTSMWTSGGTISISNSIVSINDVGGTGRLYSKDSFGINTSFRSYSSFPYTPSASTIGYFPIDAANSARFRSFNTYYGTRTTKNSVSTDTNIGTAYTNYHIFEIERNGTQSDIFKIDDISVSEHTTNIPIVEITIVFGTPGGQPSIFVYSDYVFVRSYHFPEPSPSTWTAQESAPCTAAFSGTPASGTTPLDVTFTDASTTTAGTLTAWNWSFGDGQYSEDQNPTHTYNYAGTYDVNLTVTNSAGSTDSEVKVGYITGTFEADFTGTPITGSTPLTVQFTDASSSTADDWQWDFGDGSPNSTWQSPAHTYTTSGYYTVTLTVSNGYNTAVKQRIDYIAAGDVTPTPTPPPTPTVTPTGTPPVQPPMQTGRINPFAFSVLVIIDLCLILYTWVDNNNERHFHIYTAIGSTILSFMLALFLSSGLITEDFVVPASDVTVNATVMTVYQVQQVPIIDVGVSYYFMFLGVLMLIITILASLEVLNNMRGSDI